MKLAKYIVGFCGLAAVASLPLARAQDANKDAVTIPREQYQKMLKVIEDHDKLVQQIKDLQSFKSKMEQAQKTPAAQQAETDQALDDLEKQSKSLKQMIRETLPGSNKMLLTGYGSAGFISQDHGGARQFSATFNPIFLWKLSDRLLFEGEFEAELEGHDTTIALEMAQLSYLLNDYMTIGAGKFLNPMNYFVERQHMGWVNKLPDKPLAVYDGLLSESDVGVQIRGAVPVGSTKFGYAFFAANAPELRFDPNSAAATDFGTLEFNNFDNVGRHIAVGGRVGFYPIPELEIGYGFQVSSVKPPGSLGSVNAFLQSADLSYVRDSARLQGIINLRAQWVWSHVDKFIYDPAGAAGGPYQFNNNRNGGYAQIAYRPSHLDNPFIKNLEPVFRYDMLKQARTLTGADEKRYTVGLNYWLGPSTVVKAAYEFDRQSGPNADRHNAVLLQFVTGF
jgi:hypothetical protein